MASKEGGVVIVVQVLLRIVASRTDVEKVQIVSGSLLHHATPAFRTSKSSLLHNKIQYFRWYVDDLFDILAIKVFGQGWQGLGSSNSSVL